MGRQSAHVLDRIAEIAPILDRTAAESEQLRTLCREATEAMHAAGLFGMWVQREAGGFDIDLVTQVDAIVELARADMSACWTVMIGNTVTASMAAGLPDEGFAEVFVGERLPVAAGSLKPSGRAERLPGGYRVTGKWGFGSGILHAEWIVANCLIEDQGQTQGIALAVPIAEVEVHDDWHVAGLRGTGSCTYIVTDVFVPERRALCREPQRPGNNLTNCARVGWATINRLEGEPPLQLPVRQTGYIAGVAGFIAAAAALYRGGGERLDVSETEAAALTCAPWAVMGIFIGGGAAAFGPNGKRARGRPGPLWRAADGLINYGYGDWQQWTNAMRFLGLDDLALDERFVNAWGRHQQDTRPVRNGLAEASAVRGKWDLFHGLAKLRCISGVVQDAKELRESEQFAARDFVVGTSIDGRTAHATGAPAKLSATPWRLAKPAPVLGERDSDDLRAVEPRGGCPGSGQPLSGIRVLCFTQAWAGTFCTELLALLGADVVQIETVKRPDVWRGAGAPVPPAVRNPDIQQAGINTNGMYNTVNLNKRAINLDVTHPRGKDIFWRLVPRFDVLVDNFSPHVMTNWGVTLETLHEHNPGMIFASVSGYGRQGPLAEYPANGATTEPMAGLASIHGYAGGEPMNTGGLIPDPISGYYLAASIIAALNHRKRAGVGQRIDAGMIEAVAVQVGDAVLEYDANGAVRGPGGNRHPRFAPHGVYACAGDDQWIAMAAESDAAFANLAKRIGRPGLARDERFATNAARKRHEDALDDILGAWFAGRDAAAEAETLGALGLCAARCEPFKPIYAESNAQFDARGFLVPVPHPESGTHLLPVLPWLMATTPDIDVAYSPRFGEHSREVFAEELGIGDAEYDELVRLAVTGTERLT